MKTSRETKSQTSVSQGLRKKMQQHPLFFFFLIAYAGSWIISIPFILSEWGILQGDFRFAFVLKAFAGAVSGGLGFNGCL